MDEVAKARLEPPTAAASPGTSVSSPGGFRLTTSAASRTRCPKEVNVEPLFVGLTVEGNLLRAEEALLAGDLAHVY